KNGGTIINIGGMSAHVGSKNRAHVMTAKTGLVGFTPAPSHDLAAGKNTANCVVPCAIDTARPASSQSPAHHLTHRTITRRPAHRPGRKAGECCSRGALLRRPRGPLRDRPDNSRQWGRLSRLIAAMPVGVAARLRKC